MILKRRPVQAALAGAILVVAVNLAVFAGGGSPRETGPSDEVDCILVLGAGVWNGAPSPILEDRLAQALELYQAGRSSKILVSGDHQDERYDEPNTMRVWLEARGVPARDIFMDHAGLDTYSSMWRARHVFGVDRMLVVTQRFHLRRAVWTARSLGMTAEGVAADRRPYRGAAWFEIREIASRTKAFIDVHSGRAPRHVGPRIPLEGDGRVTAG